jgi:SAM-dependent methyltransferase
VNRGSGSRVCCFCGWRGETFLPFNGIEDRLCPECHSLERQRAVAEVLLDLDLSGSVVLEAAPLTPLIFGGFLAQRGVRYVSYDRWRRGNPRDPRDVSFVDLEADACRLPFWDCAFDGLIIQHVLCQVPRDREALREIRRVLKPGGWAVIEFPIYPGQASTVEYREPAEWGNYRRYGEDARERILEAGLSYREHPYGLGSFFLARKGGSRGGPWEV